RCGGGGGGGGGGSGDALPTVIANDVIKMPDVPRYTAEYRKHLSEIFA
ncbi:hypothetical protein O6V51_20660, partial [Salmonella enterica subsp. enterica]